MNLWLTHLVCDFLICLVCVSGWKKEVDFPNASQRPRRTHHSDYSSWSAGDQQRKLNEQSDISSLLEENYKTKRIGQSDHSSWPKKDQETRRNHQQDDDDVDEWFKQPQAGVPQRFCSLFGCDCAPRPGAKCCDGYRFDRRSKTCRQLVKK